MRLKKATELKKILPLIFACVFLISLFPGKGHLEGNQRSLDLQDRTDHMGTLTALLYGSWPNLLDNWRYTLTAFQLFSLWIGMYFVFRKVNLRNKLAMPVVGGLIYVSTIFASQLVRDASLLAFATLGVGLLYESLRRELWARHFLELTGLLVLFISATFKPLYGIILGVFAASILIFRLKSVSKRVALGLLIAFSIGIGPHFVDKKTGELIGLIQVFPEKQPIIYDLASSYCWGSSDKIRNDAAKGLDLILRKDYPRKSVCASLNPITWDHLHTDYLEPWEYARPLINPLGPDAKDLVADLRETWQFMIRNNLIDWLQVRLVFLGTTLTMTNTLTYQDDSRLNTKSLNSLKDSSYKLLVLPYRILDKFRFTSLGFAMLIISLIFLKTTEQKSRRLVNQSSQIQIILPPTIMILSALFLTLIGFVASNGRYTFPYTILSYIYLLHILLVEPSREDL